MTRSPASGTSTSKRPSSTQRQAALAVLDSTLLLPGRKCSVTVPAGRTKYLHVDAPPTSATELTLKLTREGGGDPVLMASSGQWPTVSLEAVEDMVRAHYCAFESFQADVALHDLVIPDAGRYRAPHALGEVDGFPAAAPDGAARWAIGVYNFDKVKAEACEIAVLASLDAGRAQVRRLNLTRTLTRTLTLTLTRSFTLSRP